MSDVQVRDVPYSSTYEAWVDGELAGFAEYQKAQELIVFTHAEVGAGYEGQGLGSQLVRYAPELIADRLGEMYLESVL